jgi:hypothetical protein
MEGLDLDSTEELDVVPRHNIKRLRFEEDLLKLYAFLLHVRDDNRRVV